MLLSRFIFYLQKEIDVTSEPVCFVTFTSILYKTWSGACFGRNDNINVATKYWIYICWNSDYRPWLCPNISMCYSFHTGTFWRKNSQAIIGVQMASAYIGTMIMPPIFCILADKLSMIIWPFYLLTILLLMIMMHERLIRITGK